MIMTNKRVIIPLSFKKKLIAIFLASAILLTMVPLSNANADTLTRIIASGSSYAVEAKQTTSYQPYLTLPIYDSQAQHTYGYGTTIGLSSTKTTTATSSASLTVGVDAVFAEFSATMGVSSSVSHSVSTSVSYYISPTTPTGLFRIDTVFARNKVVQQKILYDTSGTTVIWSRTINYAPKVTGHYHKLTQYG